MEIKQLIELVKTLDITKDCWVDGVQDMIENQYCAGYIARCVEGLGDSLCSDDEEYRERLIDYLRYFVEKR